MAGSDLNRRVNKLAIRYERGMHNTLLSSARRADAAELIQANLESREYHEPWIQPFTSCDDLEEWFGAQSTGASAGFAARDLSSGRIVGVTRKEGFSPRYLRVGGVWCDHERWALLADDPS